MLPDELVIQASVSDERFFRMKVLEEGFPDDGVSVDADAELLEHRIDVRAHLLLSAFVHEKHDFSALVDVLSNVLDLSSIERSSRPSQKEQVAFLEAF